ncbi:MAG: 23S rRNA (uracil(1939)-C(5))-methyltransferase RlmD [Ruminococcaceae bacterium]|nr:23S rRNA (uracil(1939)-C(5))-methyltransferase RlmD [Oscillospiraceae bacterium]
MICKNDLFEIDITDLNNLGSGVGHTADGMVVFVPGAVTGDRVSARAIKVTKSYAVAKLETVVLPSPYRAKSDCSASLSCGGCVYRHVNYEYEKECKRNYVRSAFRKAGLQDVPVGELRSVGVLSGYRNKAQYPVGVDRNGNLFAGFFAANTHRVIPIADCRLTPPLFGEICRAVLTLCDKALISAYNEQTGKGLLRHLYLRRNVKGEVMLCLVVNGRELPHEKEFADAICRQFPQIVSLYVNVNRQNTNVILGEDYRLLAGLPYLEDVLCGLRFRISPQSFYQVNHDACELLYGIAKEKADLRGGERLVDLYCGIGTIGLSMIDRAKSLVGVEIVPEAVDCAKENAALNNIANATFLCADLSENEPMLARVAKETGEDFAHSVVILDPPRKGTTRALIEEIAQNNVPKVLYISCNPDTLARDCAIFRENGYEIGEVTTVDLFPRTGHVETVVLMTKK